jgi:hypothetical protein
MDRILAKTVFVEGHLIWTGATGTGRDGQPSYGKVYVGSKALGTLRYVSVHVAAYEACFGSVPTGMEVSHLCGVRLCWRPDHLIAETHRQNQARVDWRVAVDKRFATQGLTRGRKPRQR